jgi:hypothetical protein
MREFRALPRNVSTCLCMSILSNFIRESFAVWDLILSQPVQPSTHYHFFLFQPRVRWHSTYIHTVLIQTDHNFDLMIDNSVNVLDRFISHAVNCCLHSPESRFQSHVTWSKLKSFSFEHRLLILLHTHLSLIIMLSDNPGQAAHYHIPFKFGAIDWIYRVFRAETDWTLAHTSHKNTEQSTVEASITLDGVTRTDSLLMWSPNEWPSVFREISQCPPIRCSGRLIRKL